MLIQIERKARKNASLCAKSSAPACEGDKNAVIMRSDARTAACVNAERAKSVKMHRHKRRPVHQNAKEVKSRENAMDSRTAVC